MKTQGLLCLVFASYTGFTLESTTTVCDEVRKVFELKQIGPLKLLSETPRLGTDLRVCWSKNVTCCTKRIEERYQIAARKDIQNLLQISSSGLKLLISNNIAAFQEMVESLIRQAENHTTTMFSSNYRSMALDARGLVRELFTDIGLFLLGAELRVEDLVGRFFDGLFPLVHGHHPDPSYGECVRTARRDLRPFGSAPGRLAERLRNAALPGHVFLQALNLGMEVVNTTDHLRLSQECWKALLRMLYCPHCQGLTGTKPCTGYCLNVMRGCLANVAEIDGHWREFVRSLGEVATRISAADGLERALLGTHLLVNDAIAHAQRNGLALSEQVHKVCRHPHKKPAQAVVSPPDHAGGDGESFSLKAQQQDHEETLTSRRREFIDSLRLHRTFYAGLPDQLCLKELAAGDGDPCWNGADVVKSYTLRVVGRGIKAQSVNPEVRVKGPDLVINRIIDKLKHINQLLQGKSIPRNGMLGQMETGSGGPEDGFSGDCDDEDGCGGSGTSQTRGSVSVPEWSPGRETSHRRQVESFETADTSGTAHKSPADPLVFALVWAFSQLLR